MFRWMMTTTLRDGSKDTRWEEPALLSEDNTMGGWYPIDWDIVWWFMKQDMMKDMKHILRYSWLEAGQVHSLTGFHAYNARFCP